MSSQSLRPAKELPLAAIAAVVTVLIGMVLWAGPGLLREDIFDDDAAQHIYWLYRYADPQLFPGDLSIEYFLTSAPAGYRALYASVVQVFDALLASKLIGAMLLPCCAWLAWSIATAISGPHRTLRGLYAVVALIVFVCTTRNSGGILWPTAFQRSFALPLILLNMWALLHRRDVVCGLSWVGAALLYPVTLPVMGIATGLVWLQRWRRERTIPRSVWIASILGIIALALAVFGMPQAPALGPAYSYAEAANMPEFGSNGRLQLYADDLLVNILRFHMTGLGWPPLALLLILACVAMVLSSQERRALLPPAAWAFLASGLGLWLAMRLFPEKLMFGLYLPNRHSRWAIAAFGIVAVSGAAGVATERIGALVQASLRPWFARAAAVAAPLVVGALLAPVALWQWHQPVNADLERVYAWLHQLPKDALIGAHPDLADFVPLRTQRKVLSSTEESMPWMKGFYARMKPRVESLLKASYATTIGEFDAALSPYGVDVFVTGPPVWSKAGYFDPYDLPLQALLAKGRREGFVLEHPPAERVLFRSGDYYIVKVQR